jgi:hypothetical protein
LRRFLLAFPVTMFVCVVWLYSMCAKVFSYRCLATHTMYHVFNLKSWKNFPPKFASVLPTGAISTCTQVVIKITALLPVHLICMHRVRVLILQHVSYCTIGDILASLDTLFAYETFCALRILWYVSTYVATSMILCNMWPSTFLYSVVSSRKYLEYTNLLCPRTYGVGYQFTFAILISSLWRLIELFHQLPFAFPFLSSPFLGTTLISQSFPVTVIVAEPEVSPFFDSWVCFHWFVCFDSCFVVVLFLLYYAIPVTVLYSGKCFMSYIFFMYQYSTTVLIADFTSHVAHLFRNLELITSSRIVHCLLLLSFLISLDPLFFFFTTFSCQWLSLNKWWVCWWWGFDGWKGHDVFVFSVVLFLFFTVQCM